MILTLIFIIKFSILSYVIQYWNGTKILFIFVPKFKELMGHILPELQDVVVGHIAVAVAVVVDKGGG